MQPAPLPHSLTPHSVLRLVLGLLLPVLIIGFIAEDVLERRRFQFEQPLLLWVHHHSGPALTQLAVTLNTVGGPGVMGLLILVIVAALWMARQHTQALFAALSLGGAGALGLLLKFIFHRARPELWPRVIQEHGASFPSGHSTMAGALSTFVVLMLWHTRWRGLALVVGLLYAFAMGYSRLVLGVHYPTDVLAGWLTGMAVSLGAYQLLWGPLRRARQPASKPRAEVRTDAPADR